MKICLFTILFLNNTIIFSQVDTWNKSIFEKSWDILFKKMTYRHPVVFTPFELKVGYVNYGGKNYWSEFPYNSTSLSMDDFPIMIDSTQIDFNIINESSTRKGLIIDIDFLKTNFPHFIFHQNYIDFQIGLSYQILNFFLKHSLPDEVNKEWLENSSTGNYYFTPKGSGININTSLSWQFSKNRLTYLYHSFGTSSMTLYTSEGGDNILSGEGYIENFGIGTKYILKNDKSKYNYTIGLEIKWNRLYIPSITVPNKISPITGVDIRSSGIFFTTGIQLGGVQSKGDIANTYMGNNDFISAADYFKAFSKTEKRHCKRNQALEMYEYCKSQIPYQKFELGLAKLSASKYKEAIKWFEEANNYATDELKERIILNQQTIAIQLLDSVQNYRHSMSLKEAEILTQISGKLYPDYQKYFEVLSMIYIYKADLNIFIGNYSAAIDNYNKVLEKTDTKINRILKDKLASFAQIIVKEAYESFNNNQLQLTITFMKTLKDLQPELYFELEHYITDLENQMIKLEKNIQQTKSQNIFLNKKHEYFRNPESKLKLGLKKEEVIIIQGNPNDVNELIDGRNTYEMWIYSKGKNVIKLYFKNNLLIRIVK